MILQELLALSESNSTSVVTKHENGKIKQKYTKLKEGINFQLSPSRFEDSVEATEFFDAIGRMINSSAATEWVKITDEHFDTDCISKLKELQYDYKDFMSEFEKAV